MRAALLIAPVLLAACGEGGNDAPQQVKSIEIRNPHHEQLSALNPPMQMLALMRAIRDTGHRCRRVENGRFQQNHNGLKMWTARCDDDRQWAVFIAPNANLQVRPCADMAQLQLPVCRPLPAEDVPLPV